MANSGLKLYGKTVKRGSTKTSSKTSSETNMKDTVSNYKKRLSSIGVDSDEVTDTRNALEKKLNLKEDQNVLFDIFELLNRPQNALFSGIANLQEGDSFMEGLKEGFKGETDTTGKDLLVNAGMSDTEGKLDLSDILGLGIDVVADPMDYIFLPVSAAGKASKAADVVGDVAKGIKTASEATKASGVVSDVAKTASTVEDIAKTANTAENVAKTTKWVPASQALFNYAGGALKGVGNVADKLSGGKLGEATKGIKNVLTDTFNQGANTLGKLKAGQREISGANDFAQYTLGKTMQDLKEPTYQLALDRLTDVDADEVAKLNEYLSTEGNTIGKWLNKAENASSDLGQKIVNSQDEIAQNILNLNQYKNWDSNISSGKALNDLLEKGEFSGSNESAEQLKNLLSNYGVGSTVTKNATNDNWNSLLKLDDANTKKNILNNAKFNNELDNLNLSKVAEYTDDELKNLNKLSQDEDLMNLATQQQDAFKNASDVIKRTTGMDYSDITNRQGYVRKAESETQNIDNQIEQVNKKLKDESLTKKQRSYFEDIKKDLENEKASGMQGSSVNKVFGTRKYDQPAMVANRQYKESIEKSKKDITSKIENLKASLPKNKKAELTATKADLTAKREGIEEIAKYPDLINSLGQKNVNITGKNYEEKLENIKNMIKSPSISVDTKTELKQVQSIMEKAGEDATLKKVFAQNKKLVLNTKQLEKTQNTINNLNLKKELSIGDLSTEIIDKGYKINNQSLTSSLVNQINEANELTKQSDAIWRDAWGAAMTGDEKTQAKLEKQLSQLDQKVTKNSESLLKTQARIKGNVDNTITNEIKNSVKTMKKYGDTTSELANKGIKQSELLSDAKTINDRLGDITKDLDNQIEKINFNLSKYDLKNPGTKDLIKKETKNISKQIEDAQKQLSILELDESKELFNLNYYAGLEDFVNEASYTNKTARLFQDALGMGAFNDKNFVKTIEDFGDNIPSKSELSSKGWTTISGDALSKKLNSVQKRLVDSGFLTDESVQTLSDLWKGQTLYMDNRMADMFNTINKSSNGGIQTLMNNIDKVNTLFKKYSTLTPGFQLRNYVGNSLNMYLSGMPVKDIIPYQAKAGKLLNNMEDIVTKYARGELTDADNEIKLLKQFYEGGFADKAGKLVSGTAARDLQKVEENAEKGKGLLNNATKLNNKLNNAADSMNRMALLMYANDDLEKGGKYLTKLGAESPIQAVKYALMDPENMSDAEKNVIKKIIPFYTFTKQNLMFQATNLTKNTKRYKNVIKTLNATYNDLEDNSYYSYQKDSMQIPIPGANDENGNQLFLKANLPLSDLGEWLSNPVSKLAASSTPLIKYPFEVATGKNSFTGQDLNYTTFNDAANAMGITLPESVKNVSSAAEHILNNLGLQNVSSNLVKKVTSIMNSYNGETDGQALWAEIFRSILQNTNQDKVENSKLYEELEAYQQAVSDLKNQGIDVPTINQINKSNNIKLNNLKRKRASYN
jgi:hypothetical protein